MEILVSITFVIFLAVIVKAAVSNFSRSIAKHKQAPPPEETPPETHETAPENAQTPEPLPEVPPQPAGVLLGKDSENGGNLIFPAHLRGRHCYLIGKTRTGKTTLIKNMLLQDMEQGHGLCFIDPHGDACEELLATVPPERIPDVIYFDPSRTYSPSFNFFRLPFPPYKLTEDVVAVFKMFFGSAWGPRMEHLLRFSVLTLLTDTKPHTLPDLRALCINPDFRTDLIARVQDPAILEFWEHEFPTIEKGAFNPIVNKLSAFLLPGSPLLRVFSDPENDLDFSAIMNGQKILIVNLAKGVLGDEPSRLLGGLIVTGIQQAALARADIPPDQRKDFHLYIDEFQNFVVDSISTILSESAKYKLFLTLAHQTLGQLPGDIERSIFGNIATLISFQISAEDAGTLRREMHTTRLFFRDKQTGKEMPTHEFMAFVRETLLKEYQRYDRNFKSGHNWASLDKGERDEISVLLKLLDDPTLTRESVFERVLSHHIDKLDWWSNIDYDEKGREKTKIVATRGRPLFPDYDFRQTTFPDPDDFINMQARYAFCRMERADNVTAFRTVAPNDPTPGTRGQILNAMRERHANRKKVQPPPKPQQPRPAQAEPSRKSKARILKTPDVKKPPKPKKKSTGELSF